MWFDFNTYFRIIRLASRERFRWRRVSFLLFMLIILTTSSLITFLFLLLDYVFFPGFTRIDIKQPVFVLGNGRSGTTHMHRLLCGDKRYSYFRTYELLFPSISQKKLLRLLGKIDSLLLRSFFTKKIQGAENKALDNVRKMHDWRLDGAEEDEFIHFHNFSSASLTLFFPYYNELGDSFQLDMQPQCRQKNIINYYRRMVQRQLYLYGGNTVHCSKNPTFVLRIKTLMNAFPDAKFVYLIRNPNESIPSILNVMSTYYRNMYADEALVHQAVEQLGKIQIASYRYAFEVIDQLPEGRCPVIRYEELVSEPKAVIKRLYQQWQIPISSEYETYLDNEQMKALSYQSEHHYHAEGHSYTADKVCAELPQLFSRFRWEK